MSDGPYSGAASDAASREHPASLETPVRSVRARVLLFVAVWIGVACAVLSAPGCYGRNCEGGFEVYGADAGQGHMVDDTHWESSATNENWIFFPRQRYYIFDLHELGGRTPTLVLPYLSATVSPNTTGADSTFGGGNIALIFNQQPNRVDIKNDTCSDYYLRLVVEVPPLPPAAPTLDGGGDADTEAGANLDGGVTDASDAEAGP